MVVGCNANFFKNRVEDVCAVPAVGNAVIDQQGNDRMSRVFVAINDVFRHAGFVASNSVDTDLRVPAAFGEMPGAAMHFLVGHQYFGRAGQFPGRH